MNKVRRNELAKISVAISDLSSQVESLMDEEQEYYDNMPESFQGGDKGESTQLAIDSLQSVIDSFDEIVNYIDEAQATPPR